MGLKPRLNSWGSSETKGGLSNQPFQSLQHPHSSIRVTPVMPGLKYLHSGPPIALTKVERVDHPVETQTPNEVFLMETTITFSIPTVEGPTHLVGETERRQSKERTLHTDPRTPWWSKQGKSISRRLQQGGASKRLGQWEPVYPTSEKADSQSGLESKRPVIS